MKKVLSFAVLFAGISLATFAQENKDGQHAFKKGRKHHRMERKMDKRSAEEIAQFRTDRLDKSLKFTDAQRQEVYAVQLEQAQHAAKHREQMKAMAAERRSEMKASREKMKNILTEEQQKQLKDRYASRHRDTKRTLKMRKGRALAPINKEQQADTENTKG